MLGHAVRVVLGDELEGLSKLFSEHQLFLSLDLTDNVLEFVINQKDSITISGVLHDLMGNRCG